MAEAKSTSKRPAKRRQPATKSTDTHPSAQNRSATLQSVPDYQEQDRAEGSAPLPTTRLWIAGNDAGSYDVLRKYEHRHVEVIGRYNEDRAGEVLAEQVAFLQRQGHTVIEGEPEASDGRRSKTRESSQDD